jgi:outer membrane lipoprotein-sorting protein
MQSRIALALATTLLTTPLAMAATLDEIEQRVAETWAGVTSFTADMTMDIRVPVGIGRMKSEAEGRIELVSTKDSRLIRMSMTNRIGKSVFMKDGLRQDILTVFDGEHEYTEMTAFGKTQVTKRLPKQDDDNDPAGGEAIFDRLREQGDVTYAGESEFDGKPVWMIDVDNIRSKEERGKAPDIKRMRVYVAQDSGLQVRIEAFDKKDRRLMEMRYTNVELNPAIDPSRFEYTPPPGAEITDETGSKPK